MNHSFSTKVLVCGMCDAPILFISEKGELLELDPSNRNDEPEVVQALCDKIIVDFVRQFNTKKVALLTDEGAVYLWW